MDQENVNECWKLITENTNYEVSNTGKVRRTRTGRILIPGKDKLGYEKVNLSCNGKQKSHRVHRLVAIAFLDNPDNKPNIDHIDHNPSQNHVSNLRWATQQENTWNMSKFKNSKGEFKGIHKHGDRWRAQIREDGRRVHLGIFDTQKEAATAYIIRAIQGRGAFAYSNLPIAEIREIAENIANALLD